MTLRLVREDERGLFIRLEGVVYRPGDLPGFANFQMDAGGLKRGDKVSATRLPGHPVLRIRTPDLLMIRWASEQALDAAGALQLND